MIEDLIISGTNKTPEVKLLAGTGVIEISGKSIPENSVEFYQPVFSWMESYFENPLPKTEARIILEYFNTSSSKCLLDVLRKLETLKSSGKSDVVVLWHYETDDEDMMEAGQDYDALVDLPFQLIQI
jgi:hypothetical protein